MENLVWGCTRKRRYINRKQAKQAITRLKRRFGQEFTAQTIYFCHNCVGYHLTSRTEPRPRSTEETPMEFYLNSRPLVER